MQNQKATDFFSPLEDIHEYTALEPSDIVVAGHNGQAARQATLPIFRWSVDRWLINSCG